MKLRKNKKQGTMLDIQAMMTTPGTTLDRPNTVHIQPNTNEATNQKGGIFAPTYENHDSDMRKEALNKIEERLEAIRNIEDGWSSGAGKSFTDGWIDFFMNICRENYPSDLPAPKIGPSGNGGINVEWVANRVAIDLEIGDDKLKVEDNFSSVHFLILDLKDEESTENILDLMSTESWECISKSFSMLPK